MNIDIMNRASQRIMVNCDLFSGFTTACLTNSEKKEDMITGILNLVTPIRHCATVQVRTDRAPALKSLATNPDPELSSNGILLELGEHLNKNSNCSVDKKIRELEDEIRKLCPKETQISTGLLSQAVTNLNNRVRNQGLSSSQIHFSRDTHIGLNLHLDDKNLMDEKLKKRKENHESSARSKAPKAKPTIKPKIVPGQIVYAHSEGSKHEARDPLLVTDVQNGKVKVMKVLHTHSNSSKLPKISSEKILADEKFLYIPPHRRSGSLTKQRSSDDSWWRDSPPPTKKHPTIQPKKMDTKHQIGR